MNERTKRDLLSRYKASSAIYNQRYSQIQSQKYRYVDSKLPYEMFPLILDLGGGTGLFQSYLRSRVKLIIVDYSSDMLEQASRGSNNDNSMLILADVEHLPIRDAQIPLIVGFSILQNLSNPNVFLETLLVRFPKSNIVVSGIKKSKKVEDIEISPIGSSFTKEKPRGIEDTFYIRKIMKINR